MVAKAGSRRRGLATEALMLFMAYGISRLGITRFRAKIGEVNSASLALFQKLGYKEVSRSSVFKEVTLELPVDGQVQQQLETASCMTLADYES
jgi:L-amino acid N-acyltransferase YncA